VGPACNLNIYYFQGQSLPELEFYPSTAMDTSLSRRVFLFFLIFFYFLGLPGNPMTGPQFKSKTQKLTGKYIQNGEETHEGLENKKSTVK